MGADKQVTQKPCQVEVAPGEKEARATGINKVLKKTKLCHYLQNGSCPYADKCAFAHCISEISESPDLRKTKLCKAFQKGSCVDDKCNYAHGEHELRVTGLFLKKTLCVWNQKGSCRNGENCKFAHGKDELAPQDVDDAPSESTQEPSDLASESTVASSGRARRRAKRARARDVSDTPTTGASSEDDEMELGFPMKVPPPPGLELCVTPPPGLEDELPQPNLSADATHKQAQKEALMQDLDHLTRNSALLAMQVSQIRQRLEQLEDGDSAKPVDPPMAAPCTTATTKKKASKQDLTSKRTPLNCKAKAWQPSFTPGVYMEKAILNPYAQEFQPCSYF